MKKLVVICLAVLLGTGSSIAQQKKGRKGERRGFSVEKLSKQLQLDEKQVAALKDYQEGQKEERQQRQEEMRKLREEKRAKDDAFFKETLTPEQYEKWQTNRTKRMEKATKGKANKGKKGHKSGRRNRN